MLFFTPPIHLTSGQGCPLSVYHGGDADPVLLVPRAVSVEADHMIRSDQVKMMANLGYLAWMLPGSEEGAFGDSRKNMKVIL